MTAITFATGLANAAEDSARPYREPAANYLRQFAQAGGRVFVLERFDADGRLVTRSVDKVSGDVAIDSAIDRTIAGRKIKLRGLVSCPSEKVIYQRSETWSCLDAARDYAGTIYNKRASVILCKTLVLSSPSEQAIPSSCFLLVGGEGEPFRIVNDDDSMVFLGLAVIDRASGGLSRRPDLEGSEALSKSMGFQNAD
ncbi:hypothetical protein OE766_24985 [Pararhizobium sp. YC-54]|uniref:hypothetical protein n=1 Tax=Pararhizobium sp. YC-54 TaxID=2986920 RepID=UPI0021F7A874|nr:hypothetical protein [Pararhizobium sp. YC-54]MCW0001481.1 hypothetical protein [Pararhizobium sp. YC-54]